MKIDLDIIIEKKHLKNQEKRLIKELNLNSVEANIISNAIKELVRNKIEEKEKDWSEPVKEAFVNLVLGILIEEIKYLTIPPQEVFVFPVYLKVPIDEKDGKIKILFSSENTWGINEIERPYRIKHARASNEGYDQSWW